MLNTTFVNEVVKISRYNSFYIQYVIVIQINNANLYTIYPSFFYNFVSVFVTKALDIKKGIKLSSVYSINTFFSLNS